MLDNISFFSTTPTYIGIESSGSTVKIAVVRKGRKGWSLTSLKEIPREGNVNPLHNLPEEGISVTAVDSQNVLVRSTEVKLKKEKDIFSALEYQVEPLLPYPADKAILQAQIIEKKESGSALTLFAVRKDHLQDHLDQLNFSPEIVTCVPYALAAFSELLPASGLPFLILHLGEEEITCILVEQGKLLASRAFPKKANLEKEIQKTLLSFASTNKTKIFETIYLLGKDLSLREAIQKETGKNVYLPYSPQLSLSQEETARYGLALGIAISAATLNFRKKDFAYPHPWKRIKKPLSAYFVFATLLAASLFCYGKFDLSNQKKQVEQAYASLLSMEGKKGSETSFKTTQEYLENLEKLETEIGAKPDTFPLIPRVPLVKDVLGWLSSFPQLSIDTLHYSLVKRPDFSHRKEHYKVKVDLELTAKNPVAARSFHEALQNANSFVDPQGEIQWASVKGKYKVSFYLKDKTNYN